MNPLLRILRIGTKTGWASLVLGLASILSGNAAILHVPADYPTIQAAVDAATPGNGVRDEIKIAPGVYTEQVLITNRTLKLSAPGAVLRAMPGMSQTMLNYVFPDAALLGIALADVVVSGLTFEGERLGDSQPSWFDAIGCFASKVSIENCRITGFRGTNLLVSSKPAPTGIFFYNPRRAGTGVMNFDVRGCLFADNGISIWMAGDLGEDFDPTVLRTTFAINDNTIVGNGPDANGRQTGIRIWAGAGGEVKRNMITDHDYVGTAEPVPMSWGVLAIDDESDSRGAPREALQPILFEGNIFRDNQQSLDVFRGDGSTIANNSFEGRAPGYRPGGLFLTGNEVLVGTNRFEELGTGITLIGNDPDFGTTLGITSNATLIANAFCNVDTNITVEPLATYSEQGTLMTCLHPFLGIRAIQVSWPYWFNGYSVETAPSASGPWTPAEPTPFQQDGQNNVLMPMDSDQQFFRLSRP